MKKITEPVENSIIECYKKGITTKNNSIKHNVSERSIRRVVSKNNLTYTGNKTGRPKALSARESRLLIRKYSIHEIKTSSQGVSLIKDISNKNISKATVKRNLYENGFKSFKESKAPHLSRANMKARKKFYETHKGKTYDDFCNIIFTDESTFRLLNVKGSGCYYKNARNKSGKQSFIRTKKFGGGGLMIWGFITSKGDLKICRCPSKMNSNSYIKIIEEFALPEIIKCGFRLSDVVFMQDNASCHTSKMTKKRFNDNNIRLLEWPPQSPDMNPIEHVWEQLDKRVRERQNEILAIEDLWRILYEESLKIDRNYILKLYQSIPRRLNALKNAKYDVTRY